MARKKEINETEFRNLYEQGLNDTEISAFLGIDRHKIGKYRRSLNLSTNDEFLNTVNLEELLEWCRKDISASEIGKHFNVCQTTINKVRDKYNIPKYNCKVITEDIGSQIIKLYEEGLMDSEISQKLGIKRQTVQFYRKTNNLPTKFTYDKISKIDKDKFKELFNKGLGDKEIAETLGMSVDGIYAYRVRHGYLRESYISNIEIPLTPFQEQVMIGTMLGDSSFKFEKTKGVNPSLSCTHCVEQRELCEKKAEIFSSYDSTCNYYIRNTPDKRSGKYYENYTMRTKTNPVFLPYYKAFYLDGKKIIPIDLIKEKFTAVSLAYMFMDDGMKYKSGYGICTNCFSVENINEFRKVLLDKFNIHTSIFQRNVLYIKARSRDIFTQLVEPYFVDCMRYKLHSLQSPQIP